MFGKIKGELIRCNFCEKTQGKNKHKKLFHDGGALEDERLGIFVKLNIEQNTLYIKSTTEFYYDKVFDDGISYTDCTKRIFIDKMHINYCPMCGRKLD